MEDIIAVYEKLGILLVALGALISILNWVYLIQRFRTGRFISTIPLMGGVFLATGALMIPNLRPYAWLAVLLDYGTLEFLLAVPHTVRTEWPTCSWNLLEEYVGQRGGTTVRLRLFRRGALLLRWDIRRHPGECGLLGMGRVGTWEREADALILRVGEDRAVFGPLPEGGNKGWRLKSGFDPREHDRDLSLKGMEFVLRA